MPTEDSQNRSGRPLAVTLAHGWPEAIDGRSLMLRDELEAAGVEVSLLYADPAGCTTFGEWIDRYVERLDEQHPPAEPLRLLGYCFGGAVCHDLTAALVALGRPLAYVGMVEAWIPSGEYRIVNGVFRRYRVPWRVRLRESLFDVSRPNGLPVRRMAKAWLSAFVKWPPRWFRDVVIRRGRPRRRKSEWAALSVVWKWMHRDVDTPVHLYHTPDSIARIDGDPSLGLSPYLRGGYTLRLVSGDHATCTELPHRVELVRAIVADLEQTYLSQTGRLAS